MPKQEAGIKPSCALPYELYADGVLSADKKSFEIKFTAGNKLFGNKASGAPFNVYAPGKYLKSGVGQQPSFENVRTWAYGLKAGDTIADTWPLNEFEDSHYHLRVYGPNGFYREFKGNNSDPDVNIHFDYQTELTTNSLTGNVLLTLTNRSHQTQTVEIADHTYKTNNHKKVLQPSGKSNLVLNLTKSHNWYDFSVKVTGHNTFEKRYAGKVENGKPGYTDPFMGNVVG